MQRPVGVARRAGSDRSSASSRDRRRLRIAARPLLLVTAMLVTLFGWMLIHADSGRAISWYPKQCSGFADCDAKGLGNAGYEAVYTQSFWGAYGGHNCTNYVAYRLSQRGVPEFTVRGNADARNWGPQAAAKGYAVDGNIPQPGDVAWWTEGAINNASGHVAYVESVDPIAGTFVVSEDSYSGDFDWKTYRITEVSGFIHLAAGPTMTPMPAPGTAQLLSAPVSSTPTPPVPAKPMVTTKTVVARGGVATYRMAGIPTTCVAPGRRFVLRVSVTRRSRSSGFRKATRVDFYRAGTRLRRDTRAPFSSAYVLPRNARPGQRFALSARVFVRTTKGATMTKWVRTTVRVCAS